MQEKVETVANGTQAQGIHGGKSWKREQHESGPNTKAQKHLANRVAGYEKAVAAGAHKPGEGLSLYKPGSLNKNNR